MAKKSPSFEELLDKLESIVEKLELGEETLESTLKLYEEGLDISKNCQNILEMAKQKITVCESKK